MSRRPVPRIAPEDLRDHADEARIARVWERVEHDLVGLEAPRRRRSSSLVYVAIAASFAAFGGGLLTGKYGFHDRVAPATAVAATSEGAAADVLAAGSEKRSFALPGGGQLTLQPGATVELERAGDALTLKLVQGEAAIDTVALPRAAGLALVAGEAKLEAQAGSVLTVSRDQEDMDVSVRDGAVSITSPAGTQQLGRGERVDAVPIRSVTASAAPLADSRT
jgi:ferric-dicitrate binding protein FerR (iron transport regulator)